MEQVRDGKVEKLAIIFERYHVMLYNFFLRLTYNRSLSEDLVQDVFIKMAGFSPAFGMIGTLIGLVQMLSQLSDPSSIGPAMAVALLTTFYGVILSTLFFLPISGKLKARTMTEVINMEIIFEGAISILQNNNPLMVYERLSSFIPPKNRTISEREVYKL